MRVLVACEFSGIVRDAFRAKGCDAWSCDVLPSEADNTYHLQGFVETYLGDGWDLMVAHPPCTRLANSGVRWLDKPPAGRTREQMWGQLDEACEFYILLRDADIPKKAIENPVMHKHAMTRIWPDADRARHVVQPWWFGDEAFKATGFELFDLPALKPTNTLTPPAKGTDEHKRWSAIHRASPSPSRWRERSRFFPGMAAAMADQWT